MTLQRADGSVSDISVTGYLSRFKPESGNPPLLQSDATVSITDDEIAAAAWPDPDAGTFVTVDTETWAVAPGGAQPVYEGATRIGWTLYVRGGAA